MTASFLCGEGAVHQQNKLECAAEALLLSALDPDDRALPAGVLPEQDAHDKEIVPELKRQGANLNQIAKRLNERGYIDYKKELPTVLDEVKMVWQSLRQYLQKLG